MMKLLEFAKALKIEPPEGYDLLRRPKGEGVFKLRPRKDNEVENRIVMYIESETDSYKITIEEWKNLNASL